MNRGERGFTFIELLVTLVISSLIMGAAYMILFSQSRAYATQERIVDITQNLRSAMEAMTRDIRLAGYKRTGAAFNGIAAAQKTSIRVLADLDQDGSLTGAEEDNTYTWDPSSRVIWKNSPTNPLLENVTDLTLTYTLADGSTCGGPANAACSNPGNIRKISISITAQAGTPDAAGNYHPMTLTSDVTPRNLNLN